MATRNRKLFAWIAGGVVVVLLFPVGAFVYFNFIQDDPPPKFSLDTVTTVTTAPGTTASPLAGTWNVGSGSEVRYRIKETLFGQSGTAVGKTSKVTGSMTIEDTSATAATFTVDMTAFESDSGQRDGQFHGRIMDTSTFPTASFTLTSPIDLSPVPADGVQKSYEAKGKLEIHGVTNDVTLTLNTRRTGNTIEVQGNPTITFADYDIDDPSGGPASVGDSGELDFLLSLQAAT